jgi:putative protease
MDGTRPEYLLSLKDLCLIGRIRELADAGVAALKIEGRMRRPEYVAVATRAYRRALDGEGADEEALLQIYNRGGFTQGYAFGEADVACRERPNHFGVPVGTYRAPGFVLTRDVEAADQLVLRAPGAEDRPVRASGSAGALVAVPGASRDASLVRLASDAQLRAARESYRLDARKQSVSGAAAFFVGRPAALTLGSDGARVTTGAVVERARGGAFSKARAARQLQKSSDSPYVIPPLEIEADADAYVPIAAMNALRRDALARLEAARVESARGCAESLFPYRETPGAARAWPEKPRLCARASSASALALARAAGADEAVFLPDAPPKEAPEAPFTLELPQTLTDRELAGLHRWAWENEARIAATVRQNLSHFALEWPGEARAGFLMNLANREAILALGVNGYAPSQELTAREIAALDDVPLVRELIVYGRLPLMQLKHCLRRDCARCDGKFSPLVDRKGVAFPIARARLSDGCVLTVLNSVPMSVHKRWGQLPRCDRATLLFTDEPDARVQEVVRLYRALIDEKPAAADFAATTGHYFRGVE